MKRIEELKEQEIRTLTDSDVEMLIKLKKAEEGISFLEKPIKPTAHKLPETDRVVYSCGYFGDDIVFEDMQQMKEATDILDKSDIIHNMNKEYDTNTNYLCNLQNRYYNSDDMANVRTTKAYSAELFSQIKQLVKENKTNDNKYNKAIDAYHAAIDESAWISEEIWGKVNTVREKYRGLNNLTVMFKRDYMPLSNNDEAVAMNFLKKAHTVSADSEKYVLNNYKKDK